MPRRELPEGEITLLFTDIEGSTRLVAELGDTYLGALEDHRALVRAAVRAAGGHEVDTQGDAFFVAFSRPDDGLRGAVEIQRALAAHTWPTGARLTVRIGVHTGRPIRSAEGYVGMDVHTAARICAAGHGGQIVLSAAARDALGAPPAPDVSIRALGSHRLKDLSEPLALFDVALDGAEQRFPPLLSVGSRPSNLPPETTSLIGREPDLAAARALMANPALRLLTLTGPGGTGKTRLALRLAADLLPATADGAFLVSLADVAEPGLVAATTAHALGLRESGSRSPAQALGDYLASRDMVLVLDNFEHLLEAATLVPELLAQAPRLRVIATSRIPLRLAGEQELEVRPLPTGSTDDHPASSAAVALFAERARAVRPDFALGDDNTPTVREICRRLDGLPLAIELAAARVKLMSPSAMLERLGDQLDLGAGRVRDAPARHQTVRATIDWSHGLLTEPGREAFARLGIFAGTFTIEAAERVCGISLDEIADLLDQSLVHADVGGSAEPRFGMLETIRAYSRERLAASPEHDAVRERHVAYFAALATESSPELLSGEHERLLGRFDAEHDDLRAALGWLEDRGPADAALRFAGDMGVFWTTRGHYTEGRAHLERTLGAAPTAPERTRARALFGLGRLAILQGDAARAEEALQEAVAMHRRLDDARGTVISLSHLGWAWSRVAADPAIAVRLNEEALSIARASGDDWSVALALNNLSFVLFEQDNRRVRELLDESLLLRRRLGERGPLAITLGNLGELDVLEGHDARAEERLEESLSLALEIGFDLVVSSSRVNLARIAARAGRVEQAAFLYLDALPRAERLGDRRTRAECLYGLAGAAARLGEMAAARGLCAEAASQIEELGEAPNAFEREVEDELRAAAAEPSASVPEAVELVRAAAGR